MGLRDEMYSGVQAPSNTIKHAEIAEIERLTQEWLEKNNLESVPVVPSNMVQDVDYLFNDVPIPIKVDRENERHRNKEITKSGYMNIYQVKNGYSCYVGEQHLVTHHDLDYVISVRDNHRKKMKMPKARDKK